MTDENKLPAQKTAALLLDQGQLVWTMSLHSLVGWKQRTIEQKESSGTRQEKQNKEKSCWRSTTTSTSRVKSARR